MMLRTEAIEYSVEFSEKICKNCFEERKENNNEITEKEKATIIAEKWIEKGHVNVTIGGIMRLLKLGYNEIRLENDKEFINRYIEYNDLLDDELIIKLNELNDETEIEKRLERLKNLIKVLEIEVSDEELLRLMNMEYKDIDILKGFGLSQNSDSNNSLNIKDSDNESELSDYNLQDLFKEENMGATRAEMLRALEGALGYAPNTLDGAVPVGQTVNERIEELHRENTFTRMGMTPIFNGKSDEDVNEWIEEIETKFESTGRNAGNNNVNITTFAIGGLKGSALRWYREMKEANAGNLVNWTNVANDNNLRERIREKFEGAETLILRENGKDIEIPIEYENNDENINDDNDNDDSEDNDSENEYEETSEREIYLINNEEKGHIIEENY
ncbi:hypothetical protein RhiirA4_422868 [Rhizophagus irregularis]|uniref:Uncharacterized protein n=1 Tax=Rhizophagus irregularis TaxID=588596 RepID=A0A2I1GRR0_9GLOM|nr:hypothetical protein RhiirA4_422868 [Rhizophagus irregularis]